MPKPLILPLALLALAVGCAQAQPDRERPAGKLPAGYTPQLGDVLFQALPRMDLVDAIEGVTGSPYSHCGVVARQDQRWVVVEAIGPVVETPLAAWIDRGRGDKVAVYRLAARYQPKIALMIAECRRFLGRPYDARYRLDDEAIYCSELIYKGFAKATGKKLGALVRLGTLDWRPHQATIRKYERGPVPLERQMITPRDLARAPQLRKVFDNGLDAQRVKR